VPGPPDAPDPRDVPDPQEAAGLREALAELGGLGHDEPLERVLRRVVDLGVRALHGAAALSVTLVDAGRAAPVASSSPAAARLDGHQAQEDRGPVLDAARSRGVVHADLARDRRDLLLSRLADDDGLRGVTSVGLGSPPAVLGALTAYTAAARAGADDVDRLKVLASYVTVAVLRSRVPDPGADAAARLQAALEARTVVEQAKGVLMARLGLDVASAEARLADLARVDGVTLPAAAAALLERALRRDLP
jgi:hypothetical protein